MMCFLGLFIQPGCDLAHLVPIIPLLQPSLAATICTAPYGWTHQWHSQDEQLTWAQHEYIQWARNTHLLEGNWGTLPPRKFFEVYILRSLLMLFFGHSCSLTCMLASCPHESNHTLVFDLSFPHFFNWAPVSFTWAQAWVCLGVATPLEHLLNETTHFIIPANDKLFSPIVIVSSKLLSHFADSRVTYLV